MIIVWPPMLIWARHFRTTVMPSSLDSCVIFIVLGKPTVDFRQVTFGLVWPWFIHDTLLFHTCNFNTSLSKNFSWVLMFDTEWEIPWGFLSLLGASLWILHIWTYHLVWQCHEVTIIYLHQMIPRFVRTYYAVISDALRTRHFSSPWHWV